MLTSTAQTTALAAFFLALMPYTAQADGDPAAGKSAYQVQCSACHSNEVGANGVGPSFAGLAGRTAGSEAGFSFTSALKTSGLVWSEKTFAQFMRDPGKLVPGTAMAAQIPDDKTATDLYAYIATLKGGTAKQAAALEAPSEPTVTGPTQAELDASAKSTDSWLYASKDYAGARYVALDQITPKNAASLHPVCIYRSDFTGTTQTSPIIYKNVMYLTFENATVAVNASTCRPIWTHIWQPKGKQIVKTNRGAAIKDGRLVRAMPDGNLVALDMGTGKELWAQQIASADNNQYMSAPPLVYKNMVIIGPSGADYGQKSWVGAFKLESGEKIWKFNLIPDPGEPGAESWNNPDGLKYGGGSIWTPFSLDIASGVLYVPVGNPAPDFFGPARPGDNLYTNSIVALDITTGKLIWYRQMVPHDQHDSDLSQVSPLFDINAKNKLRRVVAVSGKDGLLRLLDRDTHDELYFVEITTRENVDAPPTPEGVHRCPGLLGGMEWSGPAYDRKRGLLFVPAVDWCGTFKQFPTAPPFQQYQHYYGGAVTSDPQEKAKGWLNAIDAATGAVRWKYDAPSPMVAGVVATAGGVVFTGNLKNDFLAIDEATGKVLYSFNTGGSIGGGVVSYATDGKQYVATTSGTVSAFFGGSGPSAVVIFALE